VLGCTLKYGAEVAVVGVGLEREILCCGREPLRFGTEAERTLNRVCRAEKILGREGSKQCAVLADITLNRVLERELEAGK